MGSTPMEKWTQRELLEFHDELAAAQTRERRIDDEVHWRGLEPTIVSISELPSFAPGFVWDIRRFNEDLRLYMSAINRSRPGYLMPGYHGMAIDAAVLQSTLASLASTQIVRWLPATAQLGLDGTSYSLTLTSGSSRVQWRWWEDGPSEWHELTGLVRRLIAQFKQLDKAPISLEIEPQRLRVFRQLPLEERSGGIHVGVLPAWLVKRRDVRFLVAIHCASMDDALRQHLAGRLTVGPAADIVGLVAHKLPGIPCTGLSKTDDDLPIGADTACFALDRSSDLFTALSLSNGATAVHVGEGLPPMKIEVWARRP